MPIITFQTSNRSVETERDANLLRTSIRHEGSVPFKCGGGLCGTCKVRIASGHENLSGVTKKEIERLGLDKLAQGYRLACQTFVGGDVTIAWGDEDIERLDRIAERRIQAVQTGS